MAFNRKIEQISQLSDQKEQTSKFCALIDEVLASGASVENLRSIGDKILSDEVQQQVLFPKITVF